MRRVDCKENALNHNTRYDLWQHLVAGSVRVEPFTEFQVEPFVELLASLYKYEDAYGKCDIVDFNKMDGLIANLLAFNNKRYFLYKAISNPNKIGYLSRRQYTKLVYLSEKWMEKGYTSSVRAKMRSDFLQKFGMMVSPVKLFKEAFKENPKARSLARFFHLQEDGKTTANEDILIKICEQIMQLNTGMQIKEAEHVQECYDLSLYDPDFRGSGNRFATGSCMYRRPVGGFYDAVGAKGMLVYKNGEPVARFLKWKCDDGTEYIDRLYTKGTYANDSLAEIDRQYPNAIKFPQLREQLEDKEERPQKFIPIEHPEMFGKTLLVPYIDSFPFLMKKNGKLMLSNSPKEDNDNGIYYIACFQSTRGRPHILYCPHCHQMYFAQDGTTKSAHNLYCESYWPREKSKQKVLKIFRDGIKELEVNKNDETISFKSIFEI